MTRCALPYSTLKSAAFEGVSALHELHAASNNSLYETAVLVKDGTGKITVKLVDENAPAGAAAGFLAGGLIGLPEEPVGLPVAVRGLTGLLCDLFRNGTSVTFADDVSKALALT